MMVAELNDLAREAHAVRAAFPVHSERDDSQLYYLTYMACDELQHSTGIGFDQVLRQYQLLRRLLVS